MNGKRDIGCRKATGHRERKDILENESSLLLPKFVKLSSSFGQRIS